MFGSSVVIGIGLLSRIVGELPFYYAAGTHHGYTQLNVFDTKLQSNVPVGRGLMGLPVEVPRLLRRVDLPPPAFKT